MAEMIYNPKKMEQAEDRAHRKGQSDHVTIWNLVCTGTYEVDMLEILNEKNIMAANAIGTITTKITIMTMTHINNFESSFLG